MIFVTLFRNSLDVIILTMLLYYTWQLVSKTNAIQLVKAGGVLAFVVFAIIFLQLGTLSWIIKTIGTQILVIFAFVFQPELRKFFLKLGQTTTFSSVFQRFKKSSAAKIDFGQVMEGAEALSKIKKGMLLIFPRSTKITDVIDSGVRLDADLSSALLITIFAHETPLHDGACVVEGNKIVAAGCFLQKLSERDDIKKTYGTRHRAGLGLKKYGTRHRAGLGISEASDSFTIIVSEETGAISLAYDGDLKYGCDTAEITRKLKELLLEENPL